MKRLLRNTAESESGCKANQRSRMQKEEFRKETKISRNYNKSEGSDKKVVSVGEEQKLQLLMKSRRAVLR